MSDQQTHLAMVKRKKKRKKILPYIMVLPAVVAYAMWCYYPFIKSIILSMTVANARGEIKKWVWFDNFIRLFKSQETWFMIRNTFEFAFLIGVGTFIIAMCLSLLTVLTPAFAYEQSGQQTIQMRAGDKDKKPDLKPLESQKENN